MDLALGHSKAWGADASVSLASQTDLGSKGVRQTLLEVVGEYLELWNRNLVWEMWEGMSSTSV